MRTRHEKFYLTQREIDLWLAGAEPRSRREDTVMAYVDTYATSYDTWPLLRHALAKGGYYPERGDEYDEAENP